MKPEDELAFMKALLTTWGKTWHTWPDPSTPVPLGMPLLMWSIGRDEVADKDVIAARGQSNSTYHPTRSPNIDAASTRGSRYPRSRIRRSMDEAGRQWTDEGEDKPTAPRSDRIDESFHHVPTRPRSQPGTFVDPRRGRCARPDALRDVVVPPSSRAVPFAFQRQESRLLRRPSGRRGPRHRRDPRARGRPRATIPRGVASRQPGDAGWTPRIRGGRRRCRGSRAAGGDRLCGRSAPTARAPLAQPGAPLHGDHHDRHPQCPPDRRSPPRTRARSWSSSWPRSATSRR